MAKVYDLDKKRPRKKIRVRHILVVLLVAYVGYTLFAQHMEIKQARADETRIKSQIEQLQKENERIKAELELMQSDQYIEKLAREKLGLIKPGEVMFIDVNYKDGNTGN